MSLLWYQMSHTLRGSASHWDQGSVAVVLIALTSEVLGSGRWSFSAWGFPVFLDIPAKKMNKNCHSPREDACCEGGDYFLSVF